MDNIQSKGRSWGHPAANRSILLMLDYRGKILSSKSKNKKHVARADTTMDSQSLQSKGVPRHDKLEVQFSKGSNG